MDTNEQLKNTGFQPAQPTEQQPKKGKSGKWKIVLIVLASVLIIAIIVAVILLVNASQPKNVYKKALKTINTSVSSELSKLAQPEFSSSTTLTANISNLTNSSYQSIVDIVNATSIGFNVQSNSNTSETELALNAYYNGSNIFDGSAYLNISESENKLYLYVPEFFSSYMYTSLDSDDSETEEVLSTISDAKSSALSISTSEFLDELNVIIENSEFSKEKVTYNSQNATKSTLKITYYNLTNSLITVFTNLKSNQTFLNCFKDPSQIQSELDEIISELESDNDLVNDESEYMLINLTYAGMINPEILELSFDFYDDTLEERFVFAKAGDNVYNYTLSKYSTYGNSYKYTGSIAYSSNDQSSNISFSFDVDSFGTLTLTANSTYSYSTNIQSPSTLNAVNIEDMTNEQSLTLATNFQNSEIYKYYQNIVYELNYGMSYDEYISTYGSYADDYSYYDNYSYDYDDDSEDTDDSDYSYNYGSDYNYTYDYGYSLDTTY